MLLSDHTFDKIGYEISHGADKLDITTRQLNDLIRRFRLNTYRIGKKDYIPSSELVRTQYILLGEDHDE